MTKPEPKLLSRILRDPLSHFLLAGIAIYIAYAIASPVERTALEGEKTVVVTTGEIEWLTKTWTKRWNRPPTEEELEGLIEQHVRETVLYREALAMGLDQDDVVIRRRLGQKLEFLTQDMLQPEPPADDELRAYFQENIGNYRGADTITVSHVFFNPDTRGDKTLEDARTIKVQLSSLQGAPVNIKTFGDPFFLQNYYPEMTRTELAKLFGSGFADPVFDLEPGVWHGPVLSGYGTHLVFVHSKIQQPDPIFDDVVEAVRQDWVAKKSQELNDQFIQALLDRYQVVVEEVGDAHILNGNS